MPGDEFLIARSDDRRTVFCEFRDALGEENEELFDGCGVLEFDGVLGAAQELFQPAKEEDFDANSL